MEVANWAMVVAARAAAARAKVAKVRAGAALAEVS